MGKYIILLKNNIKKNLAQYISFAIMILLASTMFYCGILTKTGFKSSFIDKWKAQNSADVFMTASKLSVDDRMLDEIKNIKNVDRVQEREGILINTTVSGSANEFNLLQNLYNIDDATKDGTMNKISIVEESSEDYDKPIYLSIWQKYNNQYKVGDEFKFKADGKSYNYKVKGFVEDALYGNYCYTMSAGYLTDKDYNELVKNTKKEYISDTVLIRKTKGADSKAIYNDLSKMTNGKIQGFSVVSYDDSCAQLRTMTSGVYVGIVLTFSLLVVIIVMLVINFKMSNTIEEEMVNMGALKAMGYKGKEIMSSMILPYVVIGICSQIAGIILSFAAMPLIEAACNIQSGIIWKSGFSFESAAITIAVMTLFIVLSCYLSTHRIKKLKVIEALHGGVKIHNFRKNHFPVDKTRGNINIILAFKNITSSIRQNILLFIVIVSLSFASVFAATMIYNSSVKPKNLMYSITQEIPSVSITFKSDDSESKKSKINKMAEVDRSIYYDMDTVVFKDTNVKTFISSDFSRVNNDICYKGKNPVHSNETAIGSKIAKDNNISIGDMISIGYGSNNKKYLVTGFIQAVDYNGYAMEMTKEGFSEINKNFKPKTLYVYLEDDNNTSKYIDKIKKDVDSTTDITDYYKSTETALESIVLIIKAISIAIFVFIALFITLILYLVIKTVIVHRKQDMGILKSLGYTTRNLMVQTSLSFLPTAAIASVFGGVIGHFGMNKVLTAMLSPVGVVRTKFEMCLPFEIICMAVIIVFTFIMSLLLCRRIKHISAYQLIKE